MAEPSYADFSSKLSPGLERPMLGVRLPHLRKLAHEYARREDWRDIYAVLVQPEIFEEQLLCGFLLGYACRDIEEFRRLLEEFMPLIDGWAVCDCCCASFKLIARHREAMWQMLMAHLLSGETYRQRFAVVALMNHYRTEEYVPRVLSAYTQLVPNGYYAEMGLAWALSVFALSAPKEVCGLLAGETWSCTVRLPACRKILESRRTPLSLRNDIQNLRQHIKTSQ